MRVTPIIAGAAVGAALGLGAITAADLGTGEAEANGDAITRADL